MSQDIELSSVSSSSFSSLKQFVHITHLVIYLSEFLNRPCSIVYLLRTSRNTCIKQCLEKIGSYKYYGVSDDWSNRYPKFDPQFEHRIRHWIQDKVDCKSNLGLSLLSYPFPLLKTLDFTYTDKSF